MISSLTRANSLSFAFLSLPPFPHKRRYNNMDNLSLFLAHLHSVHLLWLQKRNQTTTINLRRIAFDLLVRD
jgi:hypothetical protein